MRTGVAIQTSNYDWDNVDFLLDGTDEVAAYLGWGVIATGGDVTTTLGSVEVSQAYLTVEGVIPEPASILLMALGGAGVRWSRRKR